jgi:hypothetical protein
MKKAGGSVLNVKGKGGRTRAGPDQREPARWNVDAPSIEMNDRQQNSTHPYARLLVVHLDVLRDDTQLGDVGIGLDEVDLREGRTKRSG